MNSFSLSLLLDVYSLSLSRSLSSLFFLIALLMIDSFLCSLSLFRSCHPVDVHSLSLSLCRCPLSFAFVALSTFTLFLSLSALALCLSLLLSSQRSLSLSLPLSVVVRSRSLSLSFLLSCYVSDPLFVRDDSSSAIIS